MATFDTPDYVIGNSSVVQGQMITVLTQLDQALQALEPAPNATTVQFNDKIISSNVSGTATYIPSLILQANSNFDVPITTLTQNPHQVILQSGPVPIVDTLDPLPYTIVPETFNTFSYDSGEMYIGCESGNVYWFDTSTQSWNLQAQFDGAVRCIYWHSPSGKLYFGGNFNNMISPAPIGGLNKVCYISSGLPSLASVSVDIWVNYGVNGFDREVNAIVGDNDNMYFGGKFQFNSNSSLSCKFIATYNWSSTGDLYALDNTGGNGFDNIVWSLALTSSNLCVAGDFQSITTNTGPTTANFCCQIQISGTFFTVVQVDFLYSTATALSNPISKTEAVKTDGSNFYISTADSNINGAGLNYFIGTGIGASFPSVFQLGNNDAIAQQQFTLQGSIASVGSDNVYLQNNTIIATIPFASYLYWNNFYSRIEFIDLTTGDIYAFIGLTANRFTFQSGRYLEQQGTQYTGGISLGQSGSGYGFTEVLLWNGTYYTPTWILGGTPFN